LLSLNGEIGLKCLISKCFGGHPDFLWITLLKTGRYARRGLANQGFRWIARKKSNP
jgi:hypothetical protein